MVFRKFLCGTLLLNFTAAFLVKEPPKAETTVMMAMNRREAIAVASGGLVFLTTPAAALAADDDKVTLHIMDYPRAGSCGETETTEKKAFFAKQFGGLKDGGCSVEGYTVMEGTENGKNDKDKDKEYSVYSKE